MKIVHTKPSRHHLVPSTQRPDIRSDDLAVTMHRAHPVSDSDPEPAAVVSLEVAPMRGRAAAACEPSTMLWTLPKGLCQKDIRNSLVKWKVLPEQMQFSLPKLPAGIDRGTVTGVLTHMINTDAIEPDDSILLGDDTDGATVFTVSSANVGANLTQRCLEALSEQGIVRRAAPREGQQETGWVLTRAGIEICICCVTLYSPTYLLHPSREPALQWSTYELVDHLVAHGFVHKIVKSKSQLNALDPYVLP